MEILNGLLTHYHQLFKDKQQEIDLILTIIKKRTNLTLTSDEIKLQEGILFIIVLNAVSDIIHFL